jgi:hypothetical protein
MIICILQLLTRPIIYHPFRVRPVNEPRASFTVFAFVLGSRLREEILLPFLVFWGASDELPPTLLL